MEIFIWILLILSGFLLGSIMFCGIIPKRLRNKDICKISDDHNPGAFNVFKHCGKGLGIFCLSLDVLKGFIPVFLASTLTDTDSFFFTLVMVAPVLGHAIGLFNNFRGGKCIAVSFGVTAGIIPAAWIPFVVLAILYILFSTLIKIKPNRVRSIVAFVLFGIIAGVACGILGYVAVAVGCGLIALTAVIKHTKAVTEFEKGKLSDYEEEKIVNN